MTMKSLALAGMCSALALINGTAATADVHVTMNVVQVFGTIDPARSNDYTEDLAVMNMYDGLVTLSGSGEVLPLLADRWDVSEDALTYTFHLADGTTFQDGSPVEARDVVYSVQRLLSLNEGSSGRFAGILTAERVSAPDERTVVFQLEQTFSPFLSLVPVLFVLNSDVANEHRSDDDPWATAYVGEHSIGAGPFSLGVWNRGADLTIERFEGYHRGWGDGAIDSVRFVVTNEEATVKALAEAGELTLSSIALSGETYQALDNIDGFSILNYATARNFYLKLNHQVAPTDDLNIRRAIALATDYETLRSQILPGEPLDGPLPRNFTGYVPPAQPQVFDLDAARAAVAASNYAGNGPIDVELVYVAGVAFEEEFALLMKSTLDQVGFNTILRPEPWNRMTELATTAETTPAVSEVVVSPAYPAPDGFFYGQYHSASQGSWHSMEWIDDPALDALIDEARSTGDAARQAELNAEIQTYLVENQSDVFLLTMTGQFAISDCLAGFEFVPLSGFEYDFHKMHWICD